MRGFFRWLTRVTPFRLGLGLGLCFVAIYAWEIATRKEIPILTKMEDSLEDVKFHQRGAVAPGGRVVVAAVDEAAIAKFGRFPWDRRVLAELVDKLHDEGAAEIGFDMDFSDQDLGAQFAGAKRFRSRFADVSLAEGKGRAAVERRMRSMPRSSDVFSDSNAARCSPSASASSCGPSRCPRSGRASSRSSATTGTAARATTRA